MKLLLEDTVYDVPTDLLVAWMRITPKLRDEFDEQWRLHKNQQFGRDTPTAAQLETAIDTFLNERQEWYYQLLFDTMMDFRETNVEDFEVSFKIDMTPEELIEYSKGETKFSHVPIVKEPIRIPITSED